MRRSHTNAGHWSTKLVNSTAHARLGQWVGSGQFLCACVRRWPPPGPGAGGDTAAAGQHTSITAWARAVMSPQAGRRGALPCTRRRRPLWRASHPPARRSTVARSTRRTGGGAIAGVDVGGEGWGVRLRVARRIPRTAPRTQQAYTRSSTTGRVCGPALHGCDSLLTESVATTSRRRHTQAVVL